ncbi:WD repeat containing protein, variant [Trichophyton interdigitale]|uniref:WD repeat containing protein, variant n=1 Tax=Trichophyton interdigitale TaxID=101480 RepID=A0A9P4YMQ1_9EURO|nr:WD repeat containing protein, variant [Trichophyton interdigitale]KAF3900784.1 WD repeat containing protein, variant [Trichophyton interdigitale]KAG8205102.1 WD repeat containing protein, variant [Trichophyton interdigitale]
MTEKRARRPDEAQSEKPARERHRVKRRRVDEAADEREEAIQDTPVKRPKEKSKEKSPGIAEEKPVKGTPKISTPSKSHKKKKKDKEKSAVAKTEKSAVKSNDEKTIARQKEPNGWRMSPTTGGRLLNLDPVFSRDENHIILCLESAVQVYSISTSHAVRGLRSCDNTRISGCVLSPIDDEIAYVSTSGGAIAEWNWTTGETQRTMQLEGSYLLSIKVEQGHQADGNEEEDAKDVAVFALVMRNGKREISINSFAKSGDQSQNDGPKHHSVILETSTQINDFRLAAGGSVVIAIAGSSLIIGHRAKGPEREPEYTWREVQLPFTTTSFDIREPYRESSTKKGSKKPVIDLAVGQNEGAIIMYSDVLNTLKGLENRRMAEPGASSLKLHWHRGPVKTVRWSKDGNYLISGGLETVMVLWQLDTGRKQFLPHLTSTICNIVVSPKGSSYAIKLQDNSAMVLTTSELKPTASISGLQVLEDSRERHRKLSCRLPALVHPIHSNHLLITGSTAMGRDAANSSYIQTFDMRSNQQVYRQALTRTNASVLNVGPQGTQLTTPDITLIQVSHDGSWLASIDEWQQYPDDVKALYPAIEHQNREPKREVCLKFWRWNEPTTEWELVSRVNSPHTSTTGEALTVLDLAVHPQGYMFATVASDGMLRIWTPDSKNTRKMNSRGGGTTQVRSWRCSHVIPLEEPNDQPSASLCFSEDGSTLAVCWSTVSRGGLVYLVDPETGSIHLSRQGLYTDPAQGCGFIDRYLIMVSDSAFVWDTVSDRVISRIPLRIKKAKDNFQSSLAINPRSRTFATCFSRPPVVDHSNPASKKGKSARNQLCVFSIESSSPIFQSSIDSTPLALLPDTKTGEYIIIDSSASITRMTSGVASVLPDSAFAESTLPLKSGLEDIFGSYRMLPKASTEKPSEEQETAGAIEKKSLADVFDIAPSFALPSVDTLFKSVVNVFAKG